MAPCYSKNGILKGTVDFYCLVCETYLRSEADNIDHIAKPIHKKNLESTQYVKDFEEDFVRKIKKGYFCELCNKLLPMMARVKIHVNEPSHIDSKNIMFFKRIGANIVAFGKVVLNDKAWNGLNDESCAFCNTEYEDEEIHKNLLSHILNIIQIKVEVDDNKNIYRKIDDVSFHCLTCNMVLALNNIIRHFEEEQHKHLYQECCAISLNKTNKKELIEKELNKMTEDQSPKTNDRPAVQLNNTEENSQQAHTEKGSDVNRKCDVLEETTAINAMTLNKIDENEQEFKIAINFVITEKVESSKENSGDCVASPSNKTIENKEESKAVKDIDFNRTCDVLEETTAIDAMPLNKIDENKKEIKIAINNVVTNTKEVDGSKENNEHCVASPSNITVENKEESKAVKDIDVNKKNKNLAEKKVKKNKTKINPLSNTKKLRSGFNIEQYEKKICKVLKTADYITLDENGKTLCILCDWIMDPRSRNIHITGLHHQTMEKMHKRRLAEMGDKNAKEITVLDNGGILDLVSKFQANNVNINLISNTAVCKKCTVDLPYDVNAIEEHILKHNNENYNEDKVILQSCEAIDKETSDNKSDVTIKEIGNEGNAVIHENEEKLVSVEDIEENEPTSEQAPVNNDEELVSDETFLKDKAKSGTSEVILVKQSLGSFIKTFIGVKHLTFHDILINYIFCIAVTSFHYLFSIKGDIKCLICEEEVGDIEAHINTLKHIKLLNEIPVIINEKSEFVREINPELLHCGFCNMTVSSWSEMQEHLNSSFHKEIKNAAGWRMKLYSNELAVENPNRASHEFTELLIRNMFSSLFN